MAIQEYHIDKLNNPIQSTKTNRLEPEFYSMKYPKLI